MRSSMHESRENTIASIRATVSAMSKVESDQMLDYVIRFSVKVIDSASLCMTDEQKQAWALVRASLIESPIKA